MAAIFPSHPRNLRSGGAAFKSGATDTGYSCAGARLFDERRRVGRRPDEEEHERQRHVLQPESRRQEAEAKAEEVRGIDAGIAAGDHEQTQLGKHDGSLVGAFGGEHAVALERGTYIGGHFDSVIGLHG